MVVVPAGEFMMGSPASEAERFNDEGPQRTVRIAWFAVGKFEILFAEWDACVTAGGCKHRPEDQGWGRGRRPVINVSWDDITRDYVPWLSRKTGKTYRLLTEAEWEYAARAGTTTPFSMGWTITTDQANFDGNYTYGGNSKGQNRRRTVEVGSYQPNALGIHDMHGNVWEWVQDCYKDSYLSAPWDGSALADAPGCSRVLRGGSWINDPGNLRSANRIRDTPVYRDIYVGFRLARALGISNDERQLLPRTDSRLRSVPYGARPATSVVRCIEICRMEPKCQAFEFYANMETCWLQDGFTGYFETRGWHAGAKSTQ
jgi:formylglycine-generating enzyme required for sulfatase activity